MKTAERRKKRKPPEERRLDIIEAAARIAIEEGLESLTLRRVAEALGIVPGLVNHYFPAVDDLAACAFAHAAATERDGIFASLPAEAGPLAQMRGVLTLLLDDSSDAISLLWLDAWQASRRRPALRAEVATQMHGWQSRMGGLIEAGTAAGAFKPGEATPRAMRIMALIDGFSIQAAMREAIAYDTVREMVVTTIARELGVLPSALRPA